MINRTVLVGRLTKEPDLRHTASNIPVATFTLAVNRSFKNDEGKYEADFINCVVWRKQAENVEKYVHKGSLVGIDGRIQTRTFDANDGTKRYVTEVVCDSVKFLDSKPSESSSSSFESEDTIEFNRKQSSKPKNDPFEIDDDDLPF